LDGSAAAWVVVAIAAAIIEISIPQFGVIFVSLAAVASAIVAWLGPALPVQLAVFVVTLAVSLTLLRPRMMARLGSAPGVPSRTGPLIGREGVVTHDIEATVGAGRVNVGGEDWAARATAPLAAGTRIRVVAADGIVLEVTSA
jgi:membrane protein implicated in regulation of membrane protease activity